jgi:hypothetical protein
MASPIPDSENLVKTAILFMDILLTFFLES